MGVSALNHIFKNMAKQDTKKSEKSAEAKPTPKAQKPKAVSLDHTKKYNFESNGTGKTGMLKGQIYVVGGEVGELLVNRGFGKIV